MKMMVLPLGMGLPTGVVLPIEVGRWSAAETAELAAETSAPAVETAVDVDGELGVADELDELLQALRVAAAASPMISNPDLARGKPVRR
jgi:hypothetical protein